MNNADEDGDSGLQSLRHIFNALTILPIQVDGLPEHFYDIPTVNVYEAPGIVGDDWEPYLNDQDLAWIITPICYTTNGSRTIRKASGGGRWDNRVVQMKKHGDVYWSESKYILKRINDGIGLRKYTMIEYSPNEERPTHALCRMTVTIELLDAINHGN